MSYKLIIPVFCALALLMLNISAYGASFSLDASGIDGDIYTCPTILAGTEPLNKDDIPILITNQHSMADTYTFDLALPEGWSGEAALGSSVASGVTKQLFIWITVPDDEPGLYPVTLTAASGMTGDTDTVQFNIKLLNCHAAELSVSEDAREACQEDGTANFNVGVVNKGNSQETFALSVKENGQPVNFASLSQTSVTLGPGEGTQVSLGVVVAEFLGQKTLTITADSDTSYADDTVSVTIDSKDCYSFEAALTSDAGATCIGKPVEFMLSISNSGETDTFEIGGSAIAKPESEFVSVAEGTEETVKVMVTPGVLGANDFELSVTSSKDSSSRTVQGTANVEECKDVAVIVSPTKRIHCEGTDAEYQVSVKNMGSLEDTFTVTTTHGVLSDSKVVAGPGETKFLKLTVDTLGLEGENVIEIVASSEGIADYTSAQLVVENCFTAELKMQPENVTTCPCGTAFFKVVLRNTGQYPDTYLLRFGSFSDSIELAGGQAIGLNFEYEVPCDMSGKYIITAGATSATTGVEYGANAELEVREQENCWSSKIEGSKHLAVEAAKGLALPVTLSNTGEQPVTYTIEAVGPEWVYFEPSSAELNTGEETQVYLYVSPPVDTPVGEYPATVTAESDFTSSTMDLTVHVVEDITQWQPPEPELTGTEDVDTGAVENETGGEVFDVGSENQTGETDGEAGEGEVTGQFINVIPAWKTVAVGIITIVIVLILVIRFAFLVKA